LNKIPLFFVLFFFALFNALGISFQDINLSNDDRLIYRANFQDQHAIFVSYLSDQSTVNMRMQQLTAFPEKLYIADNGRIIISLSRFGAVRIPTAGGLPSVIPGYPSFTENNLPLQGRLQDLAVSADGRWILYIEPTSPGYGNLLLANIAAGTRQMVSEKIELPALGFPAKWSPDSQFFVYSKGSRLFYYPINNSITSQVHERFRTIGQGSINSVLWGQQGDFYYFTANTIYRVINPEIFTRTMFGDFLSIGNVAAVLPVDFDSLFDQYWIAPDAGAVLIKKREKGFFLYPLGDHGAGTVMPHVSIPFGMENFNVFWTSAAGRSTLTVLYSLQNNTKAWRFEINNQTNTVLTTELANTPSFATGSLSPDGNRAAFWGERGLELWDYAEWQLIQRLGNSAVLSCVWANSRHLITGDSRFIEEINILLPTYPRRIICLSGADEIAFEENTERTFARSPLRILARKGTVWFATDGRSAWTTESNIQLRPVSLSSDRFRVFLETLNQGPFRNIPMLRNLQSFTTVPLFSSSHAGHIPQGRQTQIALCFDLYDDDTGLSFVLKALHRYNKRATFFLNGEFIRRNPHAAGAITKAGHETASLFFAPIDFSDTRYRITESFITQGLARNEDEFFRITGRELSLLWHPPFFRSSRLITSAASSAGYFTVERSFDPGDWISREETLKLNLRHIPPSEMIEQIMEKITAAPSGAIIPIRLGLLPGGRDEYLFQYIEVLLDALIRSGYEVVPVSAVIRR
jgi:peptidoglycan/xylan/chitin deacetylase (PgdA/CDA1 family)